MNTKKLLGIVGSIVLFMGVFMPIVSVPIVGSMNYFQNGKGDGTIVLILAGISLILVLSGKFKGLWLTGIGSLGVTLFTFILFQSKMSQIKDHMESELAGNPFRGLADMAMQSVQLQVGWAFLIVGAGLVIASAAMEESCESPINHGQTEPTI
jgi:membrane protease YdiL (CAAX protease family)